MMRMVKITLETTLLPSIKQSKIWHNVEKQRLVDLEQAGRCVTKGTYGRRNNYGRIEIFLSQHLYFRSNTLKNRRYEIFKNDIIKSIMHENLHHEIQNVGSFGENEHWAIKRLLVKK
jgi:hypothetical protein